MLTREEVVELADAVAASRGIASGIGTTRYGAQLIVDADSRDAAMQRATTRVLHGPPRGPACRRGRSLKAGALSEDDDELTTLHDPARFAGRIPVRGPARARRLDAAGRRPRCTPIMYKPEPETKPEKYAVIYVGHAEDLSAERLPFRPPERAVLGPARGQPVEGLHLHLRGARRAALAPRADRPGARRGLSPELQRAAVRQIVEGGMDRRVLRTDLTDADRDPANRAAAAAVTRPGDACLRVTAGSASPTPSCRPGTDRVGRRQAGPARAAGRLRSAAGVTPATMPSAIPYSSGSAPATTPPVRLMCSTPGLDQLGVADDRAHDVARTPPGSPRSARAASRPRTGRTRGRRSAGTMSMTESTTMVVTTSPFPARGRGTGGAAGLRRARPRRPRRSRRSAWCRRCWPPRPCSVSRTCDDAPVDLLHQQDEEAEQGGHGQHDDETADDRPPPQAALGSGHGQVVRCMVSLPAWFVRAAARRR